MLEADTKLDMGQAIDQQSTTTTSEYSKEIDNKEICFLQSPVKEAKAKFAKEDFDEIAKISIDNSDALPCPSPNKANVLINVCTLEDESKNVASLFWEKKSSYSERTLPAAQSCCSNPLQQLSQETNESDPQKELNGQAELTENQCYSHITEEQSHFEKGKERLLNEIERELNLYTEEEHKSKQPKNKGCNKINDEKEESQNEDASDSLIIIESEVLDLPLSDDDDSLSTLPTDEIRLCLTPEKELEVEEESFICKSCDQSFSNHSALSDHLMEEYEDGALENSDKSEVCIENDVDKNTKRPFEIIKAPGIVCKRTSIIVPKAKSTPPIQHSTSKESKVQQTTLIQEEIQQMLVELPQGLEIIPLPLQSQHLPLLPPPIPLPPQEGMVISRGKWVSKAEIQRRKKKRARLWEKSGQSPKEYRYEPVINTLSGRSLPSTYEVEPDGDFACPEAHCHARYKKHRSLLVHISRNHNNNLKVRCPECSQSLRSNASMKKHLLSHRPESDWPYQCPLCGKKFQARGDLPKHWKTKKHANDHIPSVGSPEWQQLLAACVCAPACDLRSSNKPH